MIISGNSLRFFLLFAVKSTLSGEIVKVFYVKDFMKKRKSSLAISDEIIINKIHVVRGQKIMLDRDLAELYGIETKVLKQAVKRNLRRFPADFMFVMNNKEFENWRSQFVTSNFGDKMGLRYRPFCFTEQGATMLACVLNSQRAITVNIKIIRIFTRLKEMILSHKEILVKLEQLEKKVTANDTDIQTIFAVLKKLLAQPIRQRRRIGSRRKDEND